MNTVKLNRIKKDLLDKEFNLWGLDDYMVGEGYYTICDSVGIIQEIATCGNVVYQDVDCNNPDIIIDFTPLTEIQEGYANFELTIDGVEEY